MIQAPARSRSADGHTQADEPRLRRAARWSRHAAGETGYVLKDEARGRYFRLTERGLFVWDALGDAPTRPELLRAYRLRYGTDGAALVDPLLARLAHEGFIGAPGGPGRTGTPARAAAGFPAAAHRLLTARVTLTNVDPFLSAFHRRVGRHAYARPAQAAWLALALGGGAAFLALAYGGRAHLEARDGPGWIVPAILALGWLIHVPIHELQHGLTAKHYGREVRRAGLGWYWFAPMCWIDTSDMWLEGRGRRIATSFAGPYSNLVMAGGLSLVVLALPDGVLRSGLFAVALMLYLGFLTAFNVLLEYDGYYMLLDLLGTSHLRRKALVFLARDLLPRLRTGRLGRAEVGYTLYGAAALGYVVFMAAQIVLIYRAQLAGLVGGVLPAPAAAALGWVLAGTFVLVVALGVVQEIRTARAAGDDRGAGTRDDQAGAADEGGEPLEVRISK